ncbi:MAG: hypothetical protein RLZZ219_1312, partial [Cyanobacteriota bacterium]
VWGCFGVLGALGVLLGSRELIRRGDLRLP